MEGILMAAIIGIISMVFNRFQEKNKKEQTSNFPKGNQTTAESQDFSETEMHSHEPKSNRFIDRNKNVEGKVVHNNSIDQQKGRLSRRVSPIKKNDLMNKSNDYQLQFKNKQEIVKGIIFSEVLSPPRSKKRTHRG